MNFLDILFMKKVGKIKPDAGMIEKLWWKKMYEKVWKLVTIIGNPLSFFSKKAQYAKSTLVTLSPVQAGSGDPSPTNIRPITGRSSVEIKGCGKNRIETVADNVIYRNRVYSLTFNDNVITYTPNPGASTSFFLLKAFKITSDMVGKTYTYSFNSSPQLSMEYSSFVICDDDGGNRVAKNNGHTITGDYVGKNLTIRFYSSTSSIQAYTISQIQVEEGESATAYEPYTESNDVTISFGETVYGGTLDVENGEVVVDRKIKTYDGTEEWSKNGNSGVYIALDTECRISQTVLSNKYNGVSPRYGTGLNNGEICINTTFVNLLVKDANAMTPELFEASLQETPMQVVFMLATPRTIQLTSEQIQILKGENHIWIEDAGASIELSYMN